MSASFNPRKFIGFAVLAAIANTVIFLIAKSLDATMMVKQAPIDEIVLPLIFVSTLLALIFAAYAVPAIGKKSQKFVSMAPMLGLIFGIATAAAPFTATDDSKTAIALALNHIVAGTFWYFGAKVSIK